MTGCKYDNRLVKVDQCSETFYTICFEPEICKIEAGSEADKALRSACEQMTLASNRAVAVDFRHVDSGILIVLCNPMIETGDFQLESALKSLADLIGKYHKY